MKRLTRLGAGVFAVVTIVAAVLTAAALPASAHTISGPRPTNFRSRVVSVVPPIPGVRVRMVDLAAKVELTDTGRSDVIVDGYEGEPYLRVGPDGVFENLHSAATYINRSLKGGVIPSGVDTRADLPPQWHKISSGHTARWHDHRTHWMGTGLPPQVAGQEGSFHHISNGRITLTQNGKSSTVLVALDWVPGPSGLPYVPFLVIAFGLGFAVAFVRKLWRTLAVVLGVLVFVDAAHAIAYEAARPGGLVHQTAQFFGGNFVSIVVWIAAVATIVTLWQRRVEALYGVVFVGLMIGLVGGATDLSTLWKSQLPGVGPDWLTRLAVVISLGAGAGVAIGALARMLFRERAVKPAEPEDHWLAALVVGLNDRELRQIASQLDVDEVLESALGDLATRLDAHRPAFAAGSLAFDVVADDEATHHAWSIGARGDELVVIAGRAEPVATELGVAFPLLLQLLAGTVTLTDAIDSGRVRVSGDDALVRTLAPAFPEAPTAASGRPRDDVRAPAS